MTPDPLVGALFSTNLVVAQDFAIASRSWPVARFELEIKPLRWPLSLRPQIVKHCELYNNLCVLVYELLRLSSCFADAMLRTEAEDHAALRSPLLSLVDSILALDASASLHNSRNTFLADISEREPPKSNHIGYLE